ncbi:MAG: YihA family ribosome biogenesis GTP-binding protein [Clostridia bacterium]|nr:YihA family ribosome biogenesis GTP-binding protein [Clostridia bacterium]
MNFQDVSFEAAAGFKNQLKASDLPEIVFSGRSNVGKSSLINRLVSRKALARTSSQPGKTATINFYKLREARLVDLPGYGFARVSAAEKERWGKLINGYFASDRKIALVIQLLDMRHEPSAEDTQMIDYLIDSGFPFIVVCTKCDKLNKTQRDEMTSYFNELFSENGYFWMPASAEKGEGIETLREIVSKHVEAAVSPE